MRTAVSWTEPPVGGARGAVADLVTLLGFRVRTARRGRARGASAAFLVLTLAVVVVPAWTPGAGGSDRAFNLLLLLPTGMAGVVLIAVTSAVASGGGRELMPRDPGQIFPVSSTTDHLGALVLAPLNIAWLLQAWVLLGSASYAVGPRAPLALLGLQVGLGLWLLLSTAIGQLAAWTIEGIRRTAHGVPIVRMLTVLVIATAVAMQTADLLVEALDAAPTSPVLIGLLDAPGTRWWITVGSLALVTALVVVLGAIPARWAGRRLPVDEVELETGNRRPRPLSRTVWGSLVRTDRASVWRAVPMRRGLLVLAIGPGLVAVLGDLRWDSITLLPGLVVSGGALLFGVNIWCLDGRGGRWRESIPVEPALVFDARAWVLAEFLLAASVLTVLIAAARAGVPNASEITAMVASVLVITLQVVAASMRWSIAHPYAADLRSARATPAPPLAMVGYSARLAASTTVTGLVFSGLARSGDWRVPALLAVPFLAWSGVRLIRARRRWIEPVVRAEVVLAVTA